MLPIKHCNKPSITRPLLYVLSHSLPTYLRAILNKSWRQHPTRHQLYGHLPPITKTIQVRRTRHAGHCWRSRDELIRDVLLWIPTHGRAKAGRPARTYIQQLCEDTGCCPEDLPRAMNDREEWRKRVRDIRAASTIWWWWWYILSSTDRLSFYINSSARHTRYFIQDILPLSCRHSQQSEGIFRYIFPYTLSATVLLNSSEELCIYAYVVAGNSSFKYSTYWWRSRYIVLHRQTVSLYQFTSVGYLTTELSPFPA